MHTTHTGCRIPWRAGRVFEDAWRVGAGKQLVHDGAWCRAKESPHAAPDDTWVRVVRFELVVA